MAKKHENFDSYLGEQLKDPEFAAAFIMSAIVDKDPEFLPVALGEVAKVYGIARVAKMTGISRRALYKMFNEDGNPTLENLLKVLESVGLQFVIQARSKSKKTASKRAG